MAKFFGNYLLIKKENEIESTFSMRLFVFFYELYFNFYFHTINRQNNKSY